MMILFILVATMYIDKSITNGKYVRYLLRENYRDNGKVKHRTIANLSRCSTEEIQAIKLALKHKDDLSRLCSIRESISLKQGLSFGGVWLVYQVAKQLGIVNSLGSSREGKLALWQVIARVIDQGSRLSAVRLASSHACCDILDLNSFNEDDLYANLDWLEVNQAKIEKRLYKTMYPNNNKPDIFLYDVTSSYLEGRYNEFGAFGYNRDGKKGKRQIVIGLLCDQDGVALSIEVFDGNTPDAKTLSSQIRKVLERYGQKEVTFVGDRGMIKSRQIEQLGKKGFHYITAITKSQIEKLVNNEIIQMSLFDEELAEIETEQSIRYVLRRNRFRAEEIRQVRSEKLEKLEKQIDKQDKYLREHRLAKERTALRKVKELSKRLKIEDWTEIKAEARIIHLSIEEDKLKEEEKFDGCFVIKTDLQRAVISKDVILSRYKDLSKVEWAFRTSKTVELQMRPIHVRLRKRTRGHALVVMLAYKIVKELSNRWQTVESTVEEGIKALTTLCTIKVQIQGKPAFNRIPEQMQPVKKLLKLAGIRLPEVLPSKGSKVATRKKLVKHRLTH